MTKTQRHPPSRELWKFCMDRLRELRGADTRERDLANLLGFEHSRAVRWKEGQMYVDRAEYLVRLADALEVDTMTLVALAAGSTTAEQAARVRGRAARPVAEGRRARAGAADGARFPAADVARFAVADVARFASADVARFASADVARFAIDPRRFDEELRGLVLLIAADGEGRAGLATALGRHEDRSAGAAIGAFAATSFSLGLCLAERHRPDLVLLDLGVANVQAFDACHVVAGLVSRSQRRCRVVAGTAMLTTDIERGVLMAGAASLTLFPFAPTVFQSEIERLAERLGPRKVAGGKEARRHA